MDDLIHSLNALWHIPHPGPDNLFASSAFKAVATGCGRTATTIGFPSALHNILRSVGAPFALPRSQAHLAGFPEQAAAATFLIPAPPDHSRSGAFLARQRDSHPDRRAVRHERRRSVPASPRMWRRAGKRL